MIRSKRHLAIEELSNLLIRTLERFSGKTETLTPEMLTKILKEDQELQELFLDVKLNRFDSGAKSHQEPCIEELKKTYLTMLDCFANFAEASIDCVSILKNDIGAAVELEQLVGLGENVFSFLKDHEQNTAQSLAQLSGFIASIGDNLIELEARIKDTFEHTHQTHMINEKFTLKLENRMEKFSKTARLSQNLGELKKMVLSRLGSIRKTVEKRRRGDYQRLEEAKKEVGNLRETLSHMKGEIHEAERRTKALEREILLDPLTRVHNRRGYEKRIVEELHRYGRYGQSFSLILIDIDQFKEVNDNFGHAVGDRCLKETAENIKPILRQSDFLARYGGDEFVVILPGTLKQGARETAERVRHLIQDTRFFVNNGREDKEISITLSMGVTEVRSSDRDAGSLFERLDQAMYDAKKSGRNRTAIR